MNRNKMTEIKTAQILMNKFTKKYLKGVQPLIEDGERGALTNRRVKWVKFYLGFGENADANSDEITGKFFAALQDPKGTRWPKEQTRTGARRRLRQRTRARQQGFAATVSPGVTRYDGVPCAVWMARLLQKARDAGRWKGRLVSGYRTPAYSDSLCRRMCGSPSCPGRCAGRASNHAGRDHPRGAIDVSDYATFERECGRLNLGIKNELDARDPVHFSVSGK